MFDGYESNIFKFDIFVIGLPALMRQEIVQWNIGVMNQPLFTGRWGFKMKGVANQVISLQKKKGGGAF